MKTIMTGAALMMSAAPALAGGIERAPQSLAALFETGNYAEISFGRVSPDVSGRDLPINEVDYPGGLSTGDVARGYNFVGFAYKRQLQDNLSAALIVEQPYGADVAYPAGRSFAFGGTYATVNSTTYTALLRYTMDNGFGVHGGARGSKADGDVFLNGAAYRGVSGYRAKLDSAWGVGYVLGVSYERPEIGARISLTYNSKIDHDFDTAETLNGAPLATAKSTTTVSTPRSWNLEAQTGIAPDTLLMGSIRWVNWSEFRVDPDRFVAVTGEGLVSLEDTTTYTIGVGRKFTENWSGALSFTYEKAGDKLVSPLSPTTGRKGISLAGVYTQDNIKITTGISYFKLGDADPETGTPDTARATMRDSDAIGVGMRIGYTF